MSAGASRNPQLNRAGELTHLLTLEGLPAEVITHILDTAEPFVSIAEREVKKVPLLRADDGRLTLTTESVANNGRGNASDA